MHITVSFPQAWAAVRVDHDAFIHEDVNKAMDSIEAKHSDLKIERVTRDTMSEENCAVYPKLVIANNGTILFEMSDFGPMATLQDRAKIPPVIRSDIVNACRSLAARFAGR